MSNKSFAALGEVVQESTKETSPLKPSTEDDVKFPPPFYAKSTPAKQSKQPKAKAEAELARGATYPENNYDQLWWRTQNSVETVQPPSMPADQSSFYASSRAQQAAAFAAAAAAAVAFHHEAAGTSSLNPTSPTSNSTASAVKLECKQLAPQPAMESGEYVVGQFGDYVATGEVDRGDWENGAQKFGLAPKEVNVVEYQHQDGGCGFWPISFHHSERGEERGHESGRLDILFINYASRTFPTAIYSIQCIMAIEKNE